VDLGQAHGILDALADAVTIRGLDNHLIYANRAALERLGFSSAEELARADPRELMDPYEVAGEGGEHLGLDDLPSVKLLRGEEPEPLLLRSVERSTGSESWALLKAAPLHAVDGTLEGAVTIIEDVTEAKRATLRMEYLARVGTILASSLDSQQTLRNVASLAVPQIADWCAVDLFEDGRRVPVAVAHTDPAKVSLADRLRRFDPERLDPERGIGRVMSAGEPVLYHAISDEMLVAGAVNQEHLHLLREIGFRSVLIVPMAARGRTIGALTMVTAESGRVLTGDDLEFAHQIAERAALAVDNSRLYTERAEVAKTLQDGLLPAGLPQIPGWEIAAFYDPAGRGSEVGGDFYDFWEVGSDWMMMIGDVTGKGVDAAAITALVRHTARASADFDSRPAQILERVDAAFKKDASPSACTALCLRLTGGRATIAIGGHPPPLHLGPAGVREIGRSGSLLGPFARVELHEIVFTIAPGETLVAITDGVTDTVGADGERFGAERLSDLLHEAREEPPMMIRERVAAALEEFQDGEQADDRALVVMRYTGAPRAARWRSTEAAISSSASLREPQPSTVTGLPGSRSL
jgi:PAS domain S-box-containing protein